MSCDKPRLLAELLDRLGGALQLYARQWCNTPDDVVQEAFIQLAAELEWPANPQAWLFCVVRNRAISHARARQRRRRHEQSAAVEVSDGFDRRVRQQPELAEAADALDDLPLELREVVVAHFWGGLTFDEIGELTGTSRSTAHRRFETAILTLRERMELPWPITTSCSQKPDSRE